jgi:hypothetical protein
VQKEIPGNETDDAETLAEGEGLENEIDGGEAAPLEEWQKTDEDIAAEDAALESESEPADEGEEGEKQKPEKTLKAKKKLQRKLKEADEEKEALRAEIEKLKQAKVGPAEKQAGKPVRPKEHDFDSDEEYEAAQDQYEEEVYNWRQSEHTTKKTAAKEQETQIAQITKGVNGHFERAEALIESSGISPEKYNASNVAVRSAIDVIAPGKGDYVTDYLIAQLGEGSEKVFYQIGVNKASRDELISLLTEDPSGVKAAIFLGQKKEQLTNPKKRKTNAPPPASSVKGDATGGKAGGALKRAYDKAEKSGSAQAMYNAKKEAKKAGVDVSKW